MAVARRLGAIGWIRQNLVGDQFTLYDDQTRISEAVGGGVLKEDGHCSYSPDRNWILLDTYPHEDHQRRLFIYDPVRHCRIDIGRFYSMPELDGEIRCDLHPRWDRQGHQVCIDSTHNKEGRQIYVLNLMDIFHG